MSVGDGSLRGVKSDRCEVVLKGECGERGRDGVDLPSFTILKCGKECFEHGRVRIESGVVAMG